MTKRKPWALTWQSTAKRWIKAMDANSEGERVKRASKIWHAFMKARGVRIDLVQFARDATYERRMVDQALDSGVPELVAAAEEWVRGASAAPSPTPAPANAAAAPRPAPSAAPAPPAATAPNHAAPEPTSRYLRGVR
jgi:hypothetical protein